MIMWSWNCRPRASKGVYNGNTRNIKMETSKLICRSHIPGGLQLGNSPVWRQQCRQKGTSGNCLWCRTPPLKTPSRCRRRPTPESRVAVWKTRKGIHSKALIKACRSWWRLDNKSWQHMSSPIFRLASNWEKTKSCMFGKMSNAHGMKNLRIGRRSDMTQFLWKEKLEEW